MPDMTAAQSQENPVFSGMHAAAAPASTRLAAKMLAWILALVPIAGVPGEWVFQDTLKSALLAAGVFAAALALVACQLRGADGPAPRLRWHTMLLFPGALCAYALGSMAWSHTYLAAVEACRWAVLGTLLWLMLQAWHRDTTRYILHGIHGGALGTSLWVAAQFWGGLDWFPQAAPPASTFVNRNFFAEYLVCALPFSVYLLTQVRASRWRQPMALSLAVQVTALMMTGTRSALVTCALVTPLLLGALWRYRRILAASQWSTGSRWMVGLVLVTGILSLGAVPTSEPRLLQEGFGATPLARSLARTSSVATPAEYSTGSFSVRASMWLATARMVQAHPWTGVGAGAWEVHIPRFQGANNSLETDFYAHNEFLQLLGEYGLPVGGAFLAVALAYLLWSVQGTWRMPTTGPGADVAALRSVALCSLAALCLVSGAGFPWRLASTGALAMVAWSVLAWGSTRDRPALTTPMRWGLAGLALALATSGYAAVQAMRAEYSIVRSVHLLNLLTSPAPLSAEHRAALQSEAFALLKQGVAINPHYRKITSLAADQFAANGNLEAALWAQDSVAASRPYIPDVQANRVLLNSSLQRPEAARAALAALNALQPDAPRTRALDILLLRRAGQDTQAVEQLRRYFAQGKTDYDLVRFAMAIALERSDEALAIQAYQIWIRNWPGDGQNQAQALQKAPAGWRKAMQGR